MEPTLDASCLREIVRQRQDRYLGEARAHRQAPCSRRVTPRRTGRARARVAAVLHHLAERIDPARLDPRPVAR